MSKLIFISRCAAFLTSYLVLQSGSELTLFPEDRWNKGSRDLLSNVGLKVGTRSGTAKGQSWISGKAR